MIKIRWIGTITDVGLNGTYTIEYASLPQLAELGTFEFLLVMDPQKTLKLSDVLAAEIISSDGVEYLLFLDRNVLSIHNKDATYAGRRLLLNADNQPTLIVEDSAKHSIFRSYPSNEIILQWFTDGTNGYYVQTTGTVNKYLDRFLKPTAWVSIDTESGQLFVYDHDGESLELFDSSLKPLGMRSWKTDAGQTYWTRTQDGITEYLDESFKPLGWYSAERDGSTLYAHVQGKKVRIFDSELREVRQRQKEGFWGKLARGMAQGLAAYGQALRQASQEQAYSSPPTSVPTYTYSQQGTGFGPSYGHSNTFDSAGRSYSTTQQRLGSTTFSNTQGTDGFWASSTTQSLGSFDYTSGSSSQGAFSGVRQRIGAFDFTTLTTPSGSWSGGSTHLGNFTFHNFSAPGGGSVSGSSQRIGNFIFTNLHGR